MNLERLSCSLKNLAKIEIGKVLKEGIVTEYVFNLFECGRGWVVHLYYINIYVKECVFYFFFVDLPAIFFSFKVLKNSQLKNMA